MATSKKKKTGVEIGENINRRVSQGDYKRYGTSKPKVSNPFNKLGKSIGDKLVPVKKSGAMTKSQLIEEYSRSRIAGKKGKTAAKKVLRKGR